MSELLRTPDERFASLPGWPWAPNYVDDLPGYEGLRIHWVDEGPRAAARTFLCLHGEPTWGYLYRKMLPTFVAGGHRAVVPDMPGFGRSDKPLDDAVYTFAFHRELLLAFVERLDLRGVTLVCQDWGGLLGLTLPMDMPERFDGLLVMNTTLATGEHALTPGFIQWRDYVAKTPDLNCAALLARACPVLSPAEAAAYEAPFPDARHKAGVRRFPQLVPDSVDAPGAAISRRARDFWRERWSGRAFMAIGMKDPVLGPPVMHALRKLIRGCPPPLEVAEGGHFVQEWGEPIARAALEAR